LEAAAASLPDMAGGGRRGSRDRVCAASWRRGGAATRRVLLNDREGVANERERERESATREAGAQAANDAAGATTRGWGAATRRVLRASTMSLVCARGGGASAAEEQRASAVPTTAEGLGQRTMLRAANDAAGSDAEEQVLRWRRLAWPEARTADKGRGSHFSRSGPETNERIAKGIQVQAVHEQSASGALAGP
jgi:hypothetical protein